MTLRMADGPPSNLPTGMDAYAGYVNMSGIGITYPQVEILAKAQNAIALSITTNGSSAQCADVEKGAMTDWRGYEYGYCAVSNVNNLIDTYGRPDKLWTAHYNGTAHICSPACWPGLVTTADGTQWTDHGGLWDESLLSDDFFGNSPPGPTEGEPMEFHQEGGQDHLYVYQPDKSRTVHYWQASPGTGGANPPPNFYDWHSEVLPEPA